MNYPEELRERYNEVMYDERDIIEKFLKDQYDIRYGRQRDTWHFEPAVKMMNIYGNEILVTDVMLDKDVFVKFVGTFCNKQDEYECFHFAYGELSNVIEALPNAEDIVKKNALADLNEMQSNLRIDLILSESPFIYNTDKKMFWSEFAKGNEFNFDKLGETYGTDFLSKLRDHINIEVLHRSEEYKNVMEILSLEPNLRKSVDEYAKTHYGLVTFVIDGTDMEFDVSAIQRDDNGNLTIFGADTCCEDELITLTEKDIKKEYLEVILKWLTVRGNIMDEYNSHNMELVRKINAAWKSPKYHDRFGDILFALGCRDKQEIMDKFDVIIDCNETAMDNAHEIMEGVCDDWDLETILSFIRYEE